jgi:hypothetical protein
MGIIRGKWRDERIMWRHSGMSDNEGIMVVSLGDNEVIMRGE